MMSIPKEDLDTSYSGGLDVEISAAAPEKDPKVQSHSTLPESISSDYPTNDPTTTITSSKWSLPTRHRRFLALGLVLLAFFVAAAIGVAVGLLLEREEDTSAVRLAKNRQAVQELLLRVGHTNSEVPMLQDPSSPYSQALDWITFSDARKLHAHHHDVGLFEQRFLAAYLYFATSTTSPWCYCNPPTTSSSSSCSYNYSRGSGAVNEVHTHRWLSEQTECVWAGIHCNRDGYIQNLDLRT